jgi:trehalose 6-phosphate synthase
MPDRVNGAKLHQLCQELLQQRNLIVASNRGPVEYRVDEQGNVKGRRSGGGVVSALSGVSQLADIAWVASAMGEGDRHAAEQAQGGSFKATVPGSNFFIRFVVSPGGTYHKFYSVLCNPLLWFLQHDMWNASHTPNIDERVYDAWETGYKAVKDRKSVV